MCVCAGNPNSVSANLTPVCSRCGGRPYPHSPSGSGNPTRPHPGGPALQLHRSAAPARQRRPTPVPRGHTQEARSPGPSAFAGCDSPASCASPLHRSVQRPASSGYRLAVRSSPAVQRQRHSAVQAPRTKVSLEPSISSVQCQFQPRILPSHVHIICFGIIYLYLVC
jgi:hypothetical protein